MGAWIDDFKSFADSARDTARVVGDIRTDWVETQQIYKGENVAVRQAASPAATAQAQGNVLSASQWNLGAGGNSSMLILAAAAAAAFLLVKH